MKKNVGSPDKIIRFILAAVFVGLYFAGVAEGVVGVVLLVLAGIFVLTGFMNFCPIYTMLGIRTNKREAAQ